MAALPNALVSTAAALERLSLSEGDDRVAVVERLVGEVSATVAQTTGHDYKPVGTVDAPATRIVPAKPGTRYVDLYPYEVRSVSAVTLDPGGSSERVLDGSEYRLGPIPAPVGVYDRLELPFAIGCGGDFGYTPVAVTGLWGYETVPVEVAGWVLDMLAERWKQGYASFANTYGEEADTVTRTPTIPFRIREEMENARRVRLGFA